ncbi:MAG TPA: hypothetical protein VGX03_10410 [Candidatus Binatia bacterium]|nr:hypothetical protein [Candidatus Binatia bacterium]
MGIVIDFGKAYEARRDKKFCPLPPPVMFYCWACKSAARYYLVDGIQTCALCHFPKVRLTENPPMPRLSGAKDPTAPLWLPGEEKPCDREIVAWICWEILLECGLFYCPVHHPAPERNGLSASDFHKLFNADHAEDQQIIAYALKSLLEQQWAYRLARGVAGNPYRYYVRRGSCCREESACDGQIVSADATMPSVFAGNEQRCHINIEREGTSRNVESLTPG